MKNKKLDDDARSIGFLMLWVLLVIVGIILVALDVPWISAR
jgi:hypothetical protein